MDKALVVKLIAINFTKILKNNSTNLIKMMNGGFMLSLLKWKKLRSK
jgi:hypothetical protein